MRARRYKREVERRGGLRLVAAMLNLCEDNLRNRCGGGVAVDSEAATAVLRLPLVEPAELPTTEGYVREVLKRGGPQAVADAVGVHVVNVNRRMAGTARVSREAWASLLALPVTGETYRWHLGRKPGWAKRQAEGGRK